MGDKVNSEYFDPNTTYNNYNNEAGGEGGSTGEGGESGGSGGSAMECLQPASQPFHYLISEQAKSLQALQELQNEVGALLEFRDLVIETFPNLRCKMARGAGGSGGRAWEPGVRVRRKAPAADRAKPQHSVQDSGFSTETSCNKSRHLEDELWALLDVIQRKGARLKDDAELLRRDTAEECFARAMAAEGEEVARLRAERDRLLRLTARPPSLPPSPPALGHLDAAMSAPRPPRTPQLPRLVPPLRDKMAAVLRETEPIELQRQLLVATVNDQVLTEKLLKESEKRTRLTERLERAKDLNEDLKFMLEEKIVELESARARIKELEEKQRPAADSLERARDHSSMRDMQPLALPGGDRGGRATPRARRPSRIPLHTAHKGAAPRPPPRATPPPPAADTKRGQHKALLKADADDSIDVAKSRRDHRAELVLEYLARTERLLSAERLFSRLPQARSRPLPANYAEYNLAYENPQNLALELSKSMLYEDERGPSERDSLWDGRPQQYFESMKYASDQADG